MDLVRAFAIFLVVVAHAASTVDVSLGADLPGITQFNAAMAPFRMPGLMFLSGMLLARSLAKSRIYFLLGKLGRIGWPYIVWTFVMLGMTAATSQITGSAPVSMSDIARVFYSPTLYLWYLAYLLVFYLVCLFLPARIRTLAVVVAVALAFVIPDLTWVRFFYLFAFFLLGDFVTRHGSLLPRALKSPWALGVASVTAVVAATMAVLGGDVRYQPAWVAGSLGGIIVLIKVAMLTQNTLAARRISPFGRESIIFYAPHWVGMAIVTNIALIAGVSDPYLLFALAAFGGLGIGFFFFFAARLWKPTRYLFELPLTRMLNRQRVAV